MIWALLGAVVAIVLHEAAHVLVARGFGGHFAGVRLRFPFVTVRVDQTAVPVWATAPIALAGPGMDSLGAAACVLLLPGSLKAAALWPLSSAFVNLLPLPGTDGSRIIKLVKIPHLTLHKQTQHVLRIRPAS